MEYANIWATLYVMHLLFLINRRIVSNKSAHCYISIHILFPICLCAWWADLRSHDDIAIVVDAPDAGGAHSQDTGWGALDTSGSGWSATAVKLWYRCIRKECDSLPPCPVGHHPHITDRQSTGRLYYRVLQDTDYITSAIISQSIDIAE